MFYTDLLPPPPFATPPFLRCWFPQLHTFYVDGRRGLVFARREDLSHDDIRQAFCLSFFCPLCCSAHLLPPCMPAPLYSLFLPMRRREGRGRALHLPSPFLQQRLHLLIFLSSSLTRCGVHLAAAAPFAARARALTPRGRPWSSCLYTKPCEKPSWSARIKFFHRLASCWAVPVLPLSVMLLKELPVMVAVRRSFVARFKRNREGGKSGQLPAAAGDQVCILPLFPEGRRERRRRERITFARAHRCAHAVNERSDQMRAVQSVTAEGVHSQYIFLQPEVVLLLCCS